MNFIKAYFKGQWMSFKVMWTYVGRAWKSGWYGLWILAVLWGIFCSVVGTILTPVTMLLNGIAYLLSADYRVLFDNYSDVLSKSLEL